MFFFCTYFDSKYLAKGLALYRSLARHAAPFRLWVLCLDDLTCDILKRLALPFVTPISLAEFENGDKKLLEAKKNRSEIEYYFTCTPSLPLYIFNRYPDADQVTYLDADMLFYSNPRPIFEEFGNGSILIIEHRFSQSLKSLAPAGAYNVSFVSFRRDDGALKCLNWWREQCLKWCCDRVEHGRFADQKYLDDWPARFYGVIVLQHKGANLAPWNIDNYTVTYEKNRIFVDSDPLIFFHFHGLRQINKWVYEPFITEYSGKMTPSLKKYVFAPYVRELYNASVYISPFFNHSSPLNSIRYTRSPMSIINGMEKILKGKFLVSIGGRII